MPTAAQLIYSAQKLEPFLDAEDAPMMSVALDASLNLAQGTILGEKFGTNAIHSILFGGTVTGGTYVVTVLGGPTANINWNDTLDQIIAKLEAIAGVGNGNVKVTGANANVPGGKLNVEYIGALAGTAVATLSVNAAGLTGTSPTATPSSVQTGAAGTPGTFKAYNKNNTDGSQVAKLILPYAVQTDASGNITLSSTSGQVGNDLGLTLKSIPVYIAGTFKAADLVGLDSKAIADLAGRFIVGQPGSTNAIIRVG